MPLAAISLPVDPNPMITENWVILHQAPAGTVLGDRLAHQIGTWPGYGRRSDLGAPWANIASQVELVALTTPGILTHPALGCRLSDVVGLMPPGWRHTYEQCLHACRAAGWATAVVSTADAAPV